LVGGAATNRLTCGIVCPVRTLVLCLLLGIAAESRADLFTVNSTADSRDFDLKDGVADADAKTPGQQVTLRCAIENANLTPAADEVRFDLPLTDPGRRYYRDDKRSGEITLANVKSAGEKDDAALDDIDLDCRRTWWTIVSRSPLPDITAPLIMDASSVAGGGALPRIELDGSDASVAAVMAMATRDPYLPGLRIRADHCVLRGLCITGFNNLDSPAALIEASDATIEGCFLGVEPSGLHAKPNYYGVLVTKETNAARAVASNRIERCVIGGNYGAGVAIIGDAGANVLAGNWIGCDRAASRPLANGHGVLIAGAASGNRIGGDKPADANVIAFNAKDGVNISMRDEKEGADNAIVGNVIRSNAALGINLARAPETTGDVTANDRGDIDEGPNHFQNFPELISASTSSLLWFVPSTAGTRIRGTLKSNPDINYRVEFFDNSMSDSSGHGEGERLIGVINVNTGPTRIVDIDVKFPVRIRPGHSISATATALDAGGAFKSTSEFSANVEVADVLPAWLWLIVLAAAVIGILLIVRARRRRHVPAETTGR
jgi:hypothetical protein